MTRLCYTLGGRHEHVSGGCLYYLDKAGRVFYAVTYVPHDLLVRWQNPNRTHVDAVLEWIQCDMVARAESHAACLTADLGRVPDVGRLSLDELKRVRPYQPLITLGVLSNGQALALADRDRVKSN